MEVENSKTWKTLDRDTESLDSERQVICNKIRALGDKFQGFLFCALIHSLSDRSGNDASAFKTAIGDYIALLSSPFPVLFHVGIITRLFELVMSFSGMMQVVD
jgi:hypothetical protein